MAIRHLHLLPSNPPVLYYFSTIKLVQTSFGNFLPPSSIICFLRRKLKFLGSRDIRAKITPAQRLLDPEWSRLEDLFIKSCNEHPDIIYIVLGASTISRDQDREAIIQTIGKLWDIKRVKLLISISNAFFNTFLSQDQQAINTAREMGNYPR